MEKSVATLRVQLGRIYTAPAVINVITRRLLEWKRGILLSTITTTHPYLTDALHQQDQLGWDSFLEGGISKYWQQAQEYYLEFTKSPRTSKRWTTSLIQKLFNVAWDQWDHRNAILHNTENKFDQAESIKVDAAIREEFRIGKNALPRADHGLFRAGATRILARTLTNKQRWLYFVATARQSTPT